MDRIFKRLPTRIVFFVFAVTLITSLTVAGVSVRSTREFLREKINTEIETTLDLSADRIDGWYAQRLDEMRVFTSSEVLRQVLPRAISTRDTAGRIRATREVNQYLQYLLDDFPQYSSLFVLTDDDPPARIFSVGHAPELPSRWLEELGSVESLDVFRASKWSGSRLQVASAPIMDADGRRIATLHATIQLSKLSDLLRDAGITEVASLSIVDAEGLTLAATRPGEIGSRFEGPGIDTPLPDGRVAFQDYDDAAGDRLVCGLRDLTRFDWKIVYEEPYDSAFSPIVASISRVTVINLAIVFIMCLAAFRIAVSIVRPIEALSDAARRIADGERDVEIPAQMGEDEVAVLSRLLRGMTTMLTRNAAELQLSHATIEETNARLQQKNDELQEMNEILEQLSITDGLTKLHNHRYFQEVLTSECKRADRTGEPLALILFDIDEFKKWNDRLGHAGGDEILQKMARVLNDGIRETDLLARYGGEEFALLAPDTHLLGAANLAEKLRNDIAQTEFFLEPPSERRRVTVSAGIALYGGDRKLLFVEADKALYRAKDAGRDCVMIADQGETDGSPEDVLG